MEGVEARS
jgi:large subunit ribosomal protein L16